MTWLGERLMLKPEVQEYTPIARGQVTLVMDGGMVRMVGNMAGVEVRVVDKTTRAVYWLKKAGDRAWFRRPGSDGK